MYWILLICSKGKSDLMSFSILWTSHLQAIYSNYLFLDTSLDIDTVLKICRKATPTTAGPPNVNRKLQFYDGKCLIDGLGLVFWYKKAVIKNLLSTILSYLCWTQKGGDNWVLNTFTGTEPDILEWGHSWLLQGPQSASLTPSLSLSLSLSLSFFYYIYINIYSWELSCI